MAPPDALAAPALAVAPSAGSPAAGPLLVAAALLVAAGVAKLRRPDPTVLALHAVGVPAGRLHGRALGAVEVALGGAAALIGGQALAALVAAAYAGFAGFTALVLARGTGAGCGCFGAAEAPATRVHVGLAAALAAGASWAVVRPPAGLVEVFGDQPLAGLPLLGLVAVGSVLAHAAMTALPDLQAATRGAVEGGAAVSVLVATETVVLALLTLLVLGLLRSHAEILRRLHELGHGLEDEPGAAPRRNAEGIARARGVRRDEFNVFPEIPSPGDDALPEGRDLAGVTLEEGAVSVRVTGVDHATLVAFLSSSCLTCQRFWDAFRRPSRLGLAPGTRLVVVTKDPAEESPSRLVDLAPAGVPVVMSSAAWEQYRVPGSPYFVMVDGRTGRATGEGTGIDWPQVRGLLQQVVDDDALAADLDARRVNKPRADDARERRVDAELMAAGVAPGDPSLYEAPGDPAPDVSGAEPQERGPAHDRGPAGGRP